MSEPRSGNDLVEWAQMIWTTAGVDYTAEDVRTMGASAGVLIINDFFVHYADKNAPAGVTVELMEAFAAIPGFDLGGGGWQVELTDLSAFGKYCEYFDQIVGRTPNTGTATTAKGEQIDRVLPELRELPPGRVSTAIVDLVLEVLRPTWIQDIREHHGPVPVGTRSGGDQEATPTSSGACLIAVVGSIAVLSGLVLSTKAVVSKRP